MEPNTLINSISTLTQIPTYILERISDVAIKEICHEVYTDYILNEKDKITLDIGIGILYLNIDSTEGTITYSFKPSRQMEKDLIHTLRGKESILVGAVETNLNKKILNLYKELI